MDKFSKLEKVRPFNTLYTGTSDDQDKLVLRVNNGVRSNKYKEVNYDKLRLIAAEKKFSAHKTLLKVKKIEQISKQSKENSLLKQHHLVWNKELLRLNNLRKRVQSDVDAHRKVNATQGVTGCCRLYRLLDDYESELQVDFNKFKVNTTEPVWNLREDLKFWLQENMDSLRMGDPDVVEKHVEIQQTIDQVKGQQSGLLEQLYNEQLCLEEELQTDFLSDIIHGNTEEPHEAFAEGIPEEAFDLDCVDDELKVTVLQEFIIIDEKFRERLHYLEDEHSKILSRGRHGGWSEPDHYQFVVIYEQYPRQMNNRRKLIMDRLRRHLPHKQRHEFVAHEEWCEANKYFHERKRALVGAWRRGRQELYHKAKSIFTEANIAAELAEVKAEYARRQKKVSEVLYEKIRVWREQKLEAMMIQHEMEERIQEEVREKLRLEAEKEKKRKAHEKEQIQRFLEKKNAERQEQRERDERRLEELKRMMEEQAVIDKERVEFREQQLNLKIEERKKKKEEEEEKKIEKERRLEALREQVRVIAEADPERLFQQTEAWKGRFVEDEEHQDINLQRPLFEINTFTSKQITSDPRMKLEAKLREAGLHTSHYARAAMSQVKPPQPPRKDMDSTVFSHLQK